MIIELTPDTYFENVKKEGPLHVVMHYGATCAPCNNTMPHYEIVEAHFIEHNVTNVKFYRFHQWDTTYRSFIETNNLKTNGVPTFRYFYMGDVIHEVTKVFSDPNELKKEIVDAIQAIETTTKTGFDLYAN